jgi:hypothetical protein
MKTKTIELYEFDELPEAVKAKVIERNRDINVDYGWSELTISEWEERLEAQGFENPTISYSGFWSQGDGASFVCPSVDVVKFLTANKKRGQYKDLLKGLKNGSIEVGASIIRIDHRYSHEYTVRAEVEVLPSQDGPFANACYVEGDSLQNLLTNTVNDLSRKIYRELENEYEALTADSEIIETIKADEYTFRVDGTMEND